MTWRVALALTQLRSQINLRWPTRSKESDGTIGDASHTTRDSDHNPWVMDGDTGVVTALDVTHDPAHGFDSYGFADMLLRIQDPRIKYVISNRRIGSGVLGPEPAVWRPYHGANPHDHHVHISVRSEKQYYDLNLPWQIDNLIINANPPVAGTVLPVYPATLRYGDRGDAVKKLQRELNIFVDGYFGPLTEAAIKDVQLRHKLVADGVVGPQTWGVMQA